MTKRLFMVGAAVVRKSISSWGILLSFYILSLPFYGFSLFNIAGRGVARLDWLIGLVLLTLFALHSLAGRLRIIHTPANLWMFLYICSGAMSAINILGDMQGGQFVDYVTKAVQLLMVTPLFFVISSLPLCEADLRHLIRTWIFLSFGISLHSLYQLVGQIFDLPFTSFILTNPSVSRGSQSTRTLFGFTQPTSIFQEPSYMGAFLGPCFVLATVFVLEGGAKAILFQRNWLNWLLLIVIVLAVLLSNSQAILASILAALFWIFIQGLVRRTRLLQLITMAIATVIAVGLVLRTVGIDYLSAFVTRMNYLLINMADPYNTAQVTSFANRWTRIQAGIEVWQTHPLLGVGLGNMGYHTDVHTWSNSPWIQLLVEQGVIGIALLGMVFILLFYNLNGLLRYLPQGSIWRITVVAMLFLLVLTAVDGFFTLNWVHPQRIFTLALINRVAIQATQMVVSNRAKGQHLGNNPITTPERATA